MLTNEYSSLLHLHFPGTAPAAPATGISPCLLSARRTGRSGRASAASRCVLVAACWVLSLDSHCYNTVMHMNNVSIQAIKTKPRARGSRTSAMAQDCTNKTLHNFQPQERAALRQEQVRLFLLGAATPATLGAKGSKAALLGEVQQHIDAEGLVRKGVRRLYNPCTCFCACWLEAVMGPRGGAAGGGAAACRSGGAGEQAAGPVTHAPACCWCCGCATLPYATYVPGWQVHQWQALTVCCKRIGGDVVLILTCMHPTLPLPGPLPAHRVCAQRVAGLRLRGGARQRRRPHAAAARARAPHRPR